MPVAASTELFSDNGLNLKAIRRELELSQAELAHLVGFSVRAIQSCEQGWRRPGASLERAALLLLMASRNQQGMAQVRCWEVMDCSAERRQTCLTFRSGQGHLCWFLSGALCATNQEVEESDAGRPACVQCPLFQSLLSPTQS